MSLLLVLDFRPKRDSLHELSRLVSMAGKLQRTGSAHALILDKIFVVFIREGFEIFVFL